MNKRNYFQVTRIHNGGSMTYHVVSDMSYGQTFSTRVLPEEIILEEGREWEKITIKSDEEWQNFMDNILYENLINQCA